MTLSRNSLNQYYITSKRQSERHLENTDRLKYAHQRKLLFRYNLCIRSTLQFWVVFLISVGGFLDQGIRYLLLWTASTLFNHNVLHNVQMEKIQRFVNDCMAILDIYYIKYVLSSSSVGWRWAFSHENAPGGVIKARSEETLVVKKSILHYESFRLVNCIVKNSWVKIRLQQLLETLSRSLCCGHLANKDKCRFVTFQRSILFFNLLEGWGARVVRMTLICAVGISPN